MEMCKPGTFDKCILEAQKNMSDPIITITRLLAVNGVFMVM